MEVSGGGAFPGPQQALSTVLFHSNHTPTLSRGDSWCLTGTQMRQRPWVPASLEIRDLNSSSEASNPNHEESPSLKSWVKEHVWDATGNLGGSKGCILFLLRF